MSSQWILADIEGTRKLKSEELFASASGGSAPLWLDSEFVGRVPVVGTTELYEDALVRISKEPRNAL